MLRTASSRLALLLFLAPAAAAQTVIWSLDSAVAKPDDHAGYSIALLRDGVTVGHDAVIVGVPDYSDGMTNGRVYVVDAEDPSHILHTGSAVPGEHLGTSVTAVPDLTGDGRDDYAVGGAGYSSAEPGSFRVYSGKSGAYLYQVYGAKAGVHLGASIAGVDDVDGDDRGDILVGAPLCDGPGGGLDPDRGYAALYSGKTGALIKEWNGVHDNDRLGAAVAALGDLDYDGVGEFAIGVPGFDPGSPFSIIDAGACNVYSGATLSLLVSVNGGGGEEGLGSSICNLGDRDNDGSFEFAAGGPGWSNGKGRVKVYEGLQATLQATITGLAASAVADHFGAALSPGGDVDHDGHDDLIVAASREGTGLAGYAQVVSGADWSVFGDTIFGPSGSGFGTSVAGGLDVNDDDWPDAFFGMPDADTYGTNAGGVRGYRFTTIQPTLGFQGPGPTTLEVHGTELFSGGHADVVIEGLQPFAPAYLVASLISHPVSFKGGVLVPDPSLALVMFLFSDGSTTLAGMPGGGGDFDVFVQVLGKSTTAPKGWWISNAVQMEFLP